MFAFLTKEYKFPKFLTPLPPDSENTLLGKNFLEKSFCIAPLKTVLFMTSLETLRMDMSKYWT